LTGAEAIKHVIESPPCLFLLDFGLFDMTGKEVIEKLDSKKISVPFIIMTGGRDERVAVQMMKLGAVDYLTKDESFIDRLPSVVNHAVALLKDGTCLTKAEQERIHAEEALYKSEKHLHSVVETAYEGIISADSSGNIILWNRGAENIFQYSAEEIIGKPLLTIMPEQFRKSYEKAFSNIGPTGKLSSEGKSIELAGLRKDGSKFPLELSLSRWEAKEGIFFTGIVRDISLRKETEEALRESREQLHSVFTNLQDVFYRIDREGRIILLSPSAAKMLGYASMDELIGRNLAKDFYVHPDDRHAFLEELSKKGNVTDYEIELRASGGSTVIVSTNSHYYRDKNGDIAGVEGICRDITSRKKTEEELERHREHLMELVEERTHELQTSYERLAKEIAEREFAEEQVKLMALFAELNPSPVLRFDIRGQVLMANPAAIQMFPMGSLAGMPLTSLLPGIEQIDFSSCIRNGTILSHTVQIGKQHLHFIFRGIPHLDIGHLYGSDITEQKKAEDETIRASHLASLGELAAGVAHEINNPINGIINYTQILLNKSMEGTKEQDIFKRIIREGDRIAGIISSLLSFARDNKQDKAPVHIHEIMSESLALTGTQLKKDSIRLNINIPADLPVITAHSQQIEQVFLNLISNARYALSQKYPEADKNKSLDITAKKVILNNKPYVKIIFHDTGIGIPAEVKSKVINPFFTTKPGPDGTGLGLSISHGIINDHGGRIEIESVEGDFTKVIIDLPLNT
ncbi:MAG: PAS domain S-box protein, partial [Nitrospirota bacterium]